MDTIGDLISRIRNGYLARKESIVAPYSRISELICALLVKHGYLFGVTVSDTTTRRGSLVKQLVLTLRYVNNAPILSGIKRRSSPGRRSYLRTRILPHVLDGEGLAVISTSKGLMTDKEARKDGIGGELLFVVW